ncbi:MAG: precorrin-6y C5,15-methyltransferase (decarboxylating) subunit CbiE [Rhodobacter sp.]|uniref:precorrin-6y C5,15-methyltransferase (decarboxylating) subunit CbiE n=1 Tax=Pararhodobacter sp. TaxID=2127056 RepID=UPI001DC0517D|nr:precorrin-6y C5,15-methyltransferase (decarboxylating) subunit CbiE [Pararhodobacter sp.]MCB1345406.1 precorrin-6y C5,15-methyltransferase (decarboxylating) subunit CbiE [Paracoccaceae bacterium]MCC0072752.1 precorrin-6y C5,15-methyltransferase (decarboxylating) subunit CbiE [Rhodobacter sp.]HPD90997.1 precorrin-6y C5,15-methyltransferase (decarboxylating) subunit CbiE [Pararhodobacter sp.]
MADEPWLTIIGLGEDGLNGLTDASRDALARAEVVTGAARHLALLPGLTAERRDWPVPFADGLAPLLAMRGRRVVMLASGDPFWFGAGSVVIRSLAPGEWRVLPGVSCFSLAAARLGWPIEDTVVLALHAAPLARIRPYLAPGRRVLATLRDGEAVGNLAAYLTAAGFGDAMLTVLEALGGPRERVRRVAAAEFDLAEVRHPVAVGVEPAGDGAVLSLASGRADAWFDNDGQITKRPVRALALSALAPRPGETLWDIGAGSGSIAIEWLLAHPSLKAFGFEGSPDRAARARENALRLGADRLTVIDATAPEGLDRAPLPDAVFIGGGLSQTLLERLEGMLPPGTRLVAHAVTLESEALLARWHAERGGSLLRIELAEAAPLGRRRGWKSAYPVVQWSVTL